MKKFFFEKFRNKDELKDNKNSDENYNGNIGGVPFERLNNNGFDFNAGGSNMDIKKCLNFARKNSFKYIAFSKNPIKNNPKCYMSMDYKSNGDFVTKKEANEKGMYQIFKVPKDSCPDGDEKAIYKCLREDIKKDNTLKIINLRKKLKENIAELNNKEYNLYIAENQDKVQNMTPTELRNSFFNQGEIEKLRKELERKIAKMDELKEVENTLNSFSKSISDQLADKNKLIRIKNSEVQNVYDNLEKTNDSINTVTKNIYKNQSKTSLNSKMEKILHVSLTIIIILLFFMVIYYGIKFTKNNYPNQYNNIVQNFNKIF